MHGLCDSPRGELSTGVKEAKLIDRLKQRREQFAAQVAEIDTAIELLEKNPSMELLLTTLSRVGMC